LALEPAIPRFTVVLTGGTLRPLQHSLVDPMAGHILEAINVSTAFIGCNGIHPEEGVTNVNLPEAAVKRRMVEAAQRCVVAAEGSKIGNISVIKIADLDSVDLIVTGASAPSEAKAELAKTGVHIEVASVGPTEGLKRGTKE
jgi:DeoR family transcriptional regulator of aga operon